MLLFKADSATEDNVSFNLSVSPSFAASSASSRAFLSSSSFNFSANSESCSASLASSSSVIDDISFANSVIAF